MLDTNPTEREPIGEHPDGIYILYPTVTGFAHLLGSVLHYRPGRDWDADNASSRYMNGLPVLAESVPAAMAFDVPGVPMPDFYYWRENEIIISSRARAALDELGPGEIEYIEIAMTIEPSMEPADAYYYINVLPRKSLINWPETVRRVPKQHKRLDGTMFFKAIGGDKNVVFRPRANGEPTFWREMHLDNAHSADPSWVIMRADTWHELNRRFPEQLNAWRWYSPDGG